jgi:hypothetical protein
LDVQVPNEASAGAANNTIATAHATIPHHRRPTLSASP